MNVGLIVFDDVDYGLDLAEALHEIGLKVHLYLSLKHLSLYMETQEDPIGRLRAVRLVPDESRVRVFALPRMRDPRSLSAIGQIAQCLQKDEIEVAHLLVGPGDLWIAVLACLIRGIPVAATMIIPRPNTGESLPPSVVVGIYRLLALGSDAVIVNGESQVDLVRTLYHLPAHRVAYVPLGPRMTALKWRSQQLREEPGTVLFFGAARPHKGLETLIQAQPLISLRIPDARILIASRGPELQRCLGYVKDASRFEIYEGFAPGSLVAELFDRATLVALPYRTASTSGVLMTAYVFGKPVVATNVGCLPEYVVARNTGVLVPPGDPEGLADAIVLLLSDDALRREMGARALHWMDQLRRDMAIQTVGAYHLAMANHRAQQR